MLMEKQIMEQHLQETAGDLEEAERELSQRNSPAATPPREDSEDGSPKQQTPSLRQTFQDDVERLREENGAIMQVRIHIDILTPPYPHTQTCKHACVSIFTTCVHKYPLPKVCCMWL